MLVLSFCLNVDSYAFRVWKFPYIRFCNYVGRVFKPSWFRLPLVVLEYILGFVGHVASGSVFFAALIWLLAVVQVSWLILVGNLIAAVWFYAHDFSRCYLSLKTC